MTEEPKPLERDVFQQTYDLLNNPGMGIPCMFASLSIVCSSFVNSAETSREKATLGLAFSKYLADLSRAILLDAQDEPAWADLENEAEAISKASKTVQ